MIEELISRLSDVDKQALTEVGALLHACPQVFFIGNGGSAAIASHMAIDYAKAGGLRAEAFNDAASLTCLANDVGYENAFAWQIDRRASIGTAVVCISSSGRSQNILNAARAARDRGCTVVTLSGFDADNPLRKMGHANFWVDSHDYGVVEVAHLAILHSMVKG